jgi:adenylate cyclase
MTDECAKRRLAAIAVADVVGYSRLMENDQSGTLAALKERRKTVLEPIVPAHAGRIVKVMGDGVLMEFASAVNAAGAALELQEKMAEANAIMSEDKRLLLRVGINLGDIIGDGSDVSMLPRGWRRSRNRAAFACRQRCATNCVAKVAMSSRI